MEYIATGSFNDDKDLTRYFAEDVFNDRVMRTRLSKKTYHSLKSTIETGAPLNKSIAAEVAVAMKQWAIEKGATHFTHWFMPMTGCTAEKHDSFLDTLPDGQVMLNFSAKALITGESDASSFPSGGIRETAAARGYTAWDCTSPAFIKEKVLYIPTAFFSFTGEVLDKKAPLLRANQALSREAIRVLRALGNNSAKMVVSTIGPEQEYFIVEKDLYAKRPDLVFTGRTLFGARPPKSVELSDHYYGSIHPRVLAYMAELDKALWRLGITAKSRHNEVAPGQHELAIIFDPSSVAADHNMLVMETMRKLASDFGFTCLLHEKPFASINGSGKHINWSIATDDGENLLDPGDKPYENKQFLLFLSTIISAVDRYAEYLISSVATAANEHRLGSHEAPPSILSVSIGEELDSILESISTDKCFSYRDRMKTNLGVDTMSTCTVDTTDRNRTSPFAFTGNRFEFRMCGSSLNIAAPCFVLNTIVASKLSEVASKLENCADVDATIVEIIRENYLEHRRIIYHGDNYGKDWPEMARNRGLSVLQDAVEAINYMKRDEYISLFSDMGVLSRAECLSRHEILLDIYSNTIAIECRTALYMINKTIKPAIIEYIHSLVESIKDSQAIGLEQADIKQLSIEMTEMLAKISSEANSLQEAYEQTEQLEDLETKSQAYHDIVFKELHDLRKAVDRCETLMPKGRWPMPDYADLLTRY